MINILVTNDDGINAEGISTLAEALSEIGNVYVVAPETQKSACGHGITMHTPMNVKEVEKPFTKNAWTVAGTPADCVKMGVRELVKDIDLVVSGTNMGANLGNNCFYSGTVAGAAEGIFCGYPSFAISICDHHPKNYEPSMKMAKIITKKIMEKGLEPGLMLNVNLPDIPDEEIKGIKITEAGIVEYDECFKFGVSSMGNKFYWYNGVDKRLPQKKEADIQAIRDKYISISPFKFDMTDFDNIKTLKDWNFKY